MTGWALSAVVAAMLAGPGSGAPHLSVINLGQPGMLSDPPQPTLALASRGNCAEVLTAEQIDGAPSSCPPGTWPPTGDHAWAPTLEVAFGDTIELRFDQAVTAVRFSSTTDGPPGGQTAPDGQHAGNRKMLGPAEAMPTSDPSRWRIALPDPMHPLVRTGVTFSVVAEAATGADDYAFSLRGPRAAHYDGACGIAWYSPEDQSTANCPQAPPGGGPPARIPTPSSQEDEPGGRAGPPGRAQLAEHRTTVTSRRLRVGVVARVRSDVIVTLRDGLRLAGRAHGRSGGTLGFRLRPRAYRRLVRRGSLSLRARIHACAAPTACADSSDALRIVWRSSRSSCTRRCRRDWERATAAWRHSVDVASG
ncbi:MAG: hypothetical protein ACR2NB_04650 [Solirubrobacteraceae bacterium]